jgi:uridine kinase
MTIKTKNKTTVFQKVPTETKVVGSRIIMITGGSGSGKTLLAKHIAQDVYPGVCDIISHDMYYIDKDNFDPDYRVDYDAPESLDNVLLRQHITQLKVGEPAETPIYDFKTRDRLTETRCVEPQKVIIVEGILTLAIPELRELADLSIFIHVDDDARLSRRILRDFVGGARSGFGAGSKEEALAGELAYYFNYVKPNYQKYIAPLAETADLVVHNNAKTPEPMLERIENILTKFQLR